MHIHLQKSLFEAMDAVSINAIAAWRRWRQRLPESLAYLPQSITANAVTHIVAGLAITMTFAVGAVAVRLFPYQFAKADLDRLQQQELSLKQAYIHRLPDAPRIDLLQAGKRGAEQTLALLRQQLTGSSEQEAVMNEIDTAGRARGLRFIMFKPDARQKTTIQISAIGSYQAIARFVDDIAQLPRIVLLDPLTLQAANDGDRSGDDPHAPIGLLNLQATAIAVQPAQSNDDPDEARK
ncbi:MAG TPA: type 4a pilus biogenesis protein PilO [Herbaspirillum sp.]|jgi:Tfp pilus assembly protein PilO